MQHIPVTSIPGFTIVVFKDSLKEFHACDTNLTLTVSIWLGFCTSFWGMSTGNSGKIREFQESNLDDLFTVEHSLMKMYTSL